MTHSERMNRDRQRRMKNNTSVGNQIEVKRTQVEQAKANRAARLQDDSTANLAFPLDAERMVTITCPKPLSRRDLKHIMYMLEPLCEEEANQTNRILALKNEGKSPRLIAKELGMARSTVQRRIKKDMLQIGAQK